MDNIECYNLERDLFAAGLRPAIDIGRSVSRIGGTVSRNVALQTDFH
jgi:F0F1-type ATP synthase alpha subunit